MTFRAFLAAMAVAFVMLTGSVFAVGTQVNVDKQLGCEPRFFSLNASGGFIEAKAELFNSGTVGYMARARLDVMAGGSLIFSGWSGEKAVLPGERVPYRVYWFGKDSQSVTARMKIICATETSETENMTQQINPSGAEDVFSVADIRTYDNEMRFDLKSERDVSEAVVFVSDSMPGWAFDELVVHGMKAGKPVAVRMPYYSGVFVNNTISMNVAGDRGQYYTKTSYDMKKESGAMMYWNMLIDFFKSLTRF